MLVFYPADWSPVCGDQLALYSELQDEWRKHHAQILAISVDNTWCHVAYANDRKLRFPLLADFEPIFAERMMRMISHERPLLLVADENLFAVTLKYQERDLDEELAVIEATRKKMARILRSLPPEVSNRVGVHSFKGLVSLEAVLTSAWSYSRRPLRIPVSTTRKPTRLSATIATTIDVQPDTVEVATQLDYIVEFAGVDTFRFLVPEAVSPSVQIEAEASGPSSVAIKQRLNGDATNGWVPWTVVMPREIVGRQRFRITYRLSGETAAPAPAAPRRS